MRNTPERDDRPSPEPRRQYGGKWKGRGGRRLRNEGRREEREQNRGGKEKVHLTPRDLERLLAAEAWSDEADTGAAALEDTTTGKPDGDQ